MQTMGALSTTKATPKWYHFKVSYCATYCKQHRENVPKRGPTRNPFIPSFIKEPTTEMQAPMGCLPVMSLEILKVATSEREAFERHSTWVVHVLVYVWGTFSNLQPFANPPPDVCVCACLPTVSVLPPRDPWPIWRSIHLMTSDHTIQDVETGGVLISGVELWIAFTWARQSIVSWESA